MSNSLFSTFLSFYSNKKLLIVTHNEADLDAIASAFAVSSTLKNSKIALLDEPNDAAKLLIKKLDIKVHYLKDFKKEDFEGLVITDCSTSALLRGIEGWPILCIIDHHRKSGKNIDGKFEIIEEECPSASEVVAKLLPKIEKNIAYALAIGIISDTAQFSSSRLETFEMFVKLMKICGAEYSELLYHSFPPRSLDKKIAITKALKNTEFLIHGNIIISTTEAGSNESDVATTLVQSVDVSFVAKEDSDDSKYSKISARVSKTFDVKINEVMKEVGESLSGKGGGHYKAAGARVLASKRDGLKKCVEILIKKLNSK
ncbi:DHH family phosphoesterase [Candidatus Micrarchaeota archaeon]|nr:DHH family phosphoesterase [Candidatus Micrarchaeota archaeon]